MYIRKTIDEYQIWGCYPAGDEELSVYDVRKDCYVDLKAYRTNEPNVRFYMKKIRVKKEN